MRQMPSLACVAALAVAAFVVASADIPTEAKASDSLPLTSSLALRESDAGSEHFRSMDPGDSDKGLSKALSTFQQAGAASGIATIGLGLLAAYQKRFSSIHLLRAKLIQQGYENVQKEITKKARASLDIIAGQMETLSGDMDRRVADLVRDVGLGVVAYLPVTASEYKAKFGPNLVDTAKQVLDDNKNLVLLNHGKPAPFSATSDPILRPLKSALSTYETTPTADNAKMLRAALGDLVRDDFDRIHHANVLGDTKSAFAKGALRVNHSVITRRGDASW